MLLHSLHASNTKLNSMEMLLTCIKCKGPPTLYGELHSMPCGRQEKCCVLWGVGIFLVLFLILGTDSVCALAICMWLEEP